MSFHNDYDDDDEFSPRLDGGRPIFEAITLQLPQEQPTKSRAGGMSFEDLPDGGFRVIEGGLSLMEQFGPMPDTLEQDWEENLALNLSETELSGIADEILQMIDEDEQSREGWRERFAHGLEIIGMEDEPEDDSPFPGAASVTHPLIIEATVQSQARAMAELVPPGGPCKTIVLGEETEVETAKAERVKNYMNYQCTVEEPGYYPNKEKLLMYIPIYGCAFTKTYRNTLLDRTQTDFIRPDDLIVPYDASSLEDASRITHMMRVSGNELKKEMAVGKYMKVELEDLNDPETQKGNQDLVDRLDNRTSPQAALHTNQHIIYECHIEYDLPGYEELDDDQEPTGIGLPYIITIEEESDQVLSIRRNYDFDDRLKRKRMWFTQYNYLPGLGFYGWGLIHAIGSLNEACTGIIRAMLDGAAFASNQGGFVSDSARIDGGELVLQPGTYQKVKISAEDLARAFYTPQFKEPSSAFPLLLEAMTKMGQRFSSTTEAMVGDAPAQNAPVGSVIAMIEQGSKVYSGIHQRNHKSLGEELQLRKKVNAQYVPADGYPYKVPGADRNIYADDFDDTIDVVPISDPKIFSQTQRIAKAQAVEQLAAQYPAEFTPSKVVKRMLDAIDIPNPDEVLRSNKIPSMDPVTENSAMTLGRPVQAYMAEDHDAHIAVHMAYMLHPQFGGNPQAQQILAPAMIAHMAEHMAFKNMQAFLSMGVPLPEIDLSTTDPEEFMQELPIEVQNQIAQAAAMNLQGFAQATGVAAPPPEPDPQMAKAQMDIQFHEANQKQKLEHKQEDHEQDLRHDQETHVQEISQVAGGAAGDQHREAVKAGKEERRKDVAAAGDERRDDKAAVGDERRDNFKAAGDEARERRKPTKETDK